jgi:hypothetical protein
MKALCILIGLVLIAGLGFSCREIQKTAGLQRMVHDIPCQDLKIQIIDQLRARKIPAEFRDEIKGLIEAGPFFDQPFPPDTYPKVEEKYQLEVTCLDELSSRITLKSRIRAQGEGNQWFEVTDPRKKELYEKRFLERLMIK